MKAKRSQNFDKVNSITAEFCAVLAAISLGVWLSVIERREERKEVAINLLAGAEVFARAVANLKSTERNIKSDSDQNNQPFPSPNIFDTLLSSPEFYEFSTSYHVQLLAQSVVDFRRSDKFHSWYNCHKDDPDHIDHCLTTAGFKSEAQQLSIFFCIVKEDIRLGTRQVDILFEEYGGNFSDFSRTVYEEDFDECFSSKG